MSVLVGQDIRQCVAGITGGEKVEGVPVFDTFDEAVARTDANAAMVSVPARSAADSILEAAEAGIKLIVTITEGIPAHDELRVITQLRRRPGVRLVAPTVPGSCLRARPTSGSFRMPSSGMEMSAWSHGVGR